MKNYSNPHLSLMRSKRPQLCPLLFKVYTVQITTETYRLERTECCVPSLLDDQIGVTLPAGLSMDLTYRAAVAWGCWQVLIPPLSPPPSQVKSPLSAVCNGTTGHYDEPSRWKIHFITMYNNILLST